MLSCFVPFVKFVQITMKSLPAFVFLLLIPLNLFAQKPTSSQKKIELLYNEALNLSRDGNSAKSEQLLYEILKLDSAWYMAHFALADLAHEAGKSKAEIENLQKGLAISGDSYIGGFKFLAEALFKNGDYSEALSRMEHYATLKKSLNSAEQLLLASCRFSVEAVSHPVPFHPVNPGDSINTDAAEYWPSLNAEANKLVFTRLETKEKNGQKIPRPQEDFYYAIYDTISWHKAKPVGPPVNTDENEGAQTLSADGKLLIFTGCGRSDGVGSCDLYISVNKNGKWTVPVNMGEPVNSGAWESQPALSADGENLYFVSSRAGGKGNMDIWKAEKTGVSTSGVPQYGNVTNVTEINTPGNDLSPFIHADSNTFYFSSDGRPGLGGTDIYMTRLKNGNLSEPVNLGYPINSNRNEDGLFVERSGERAWFSSNRNTDHSWDIFYFNLPDWLMPDPVSYMKGTVVDAGTFKKLSVDIVLTNLSTKKVVRRITPAENDGEFLVCLPSGINYGLNISRKGYLFASENISLVNGNSQKKPQEVKILLMPVKTGAFTTLSNIFFETNSFQLTDESQTQLDEITQFMLQNPGVVVEVVGHTDHVGTKEYNLELSAKRAEAVVLELKKRNVEPWRLKSRGAGFAFPVGDNETEEGRRANRRTEFLIKEVRRE